MRSLAVRAAGEPRQELTSFASVAPDGASRLASLVSLARSAGCPSSVAPSGRSQVDRVPSCRLETIFFSERFRTIVSS